MTWCKKYFLENELTLNTEVLRVPNFIIETTATMRPTTTSATQVYFEWFCEQGSQYALDLTDSQLSTIGRQDATGGERGNAFERYMSTQLTLLAKGAFQFFYRELTSPAQWHSLPFVVRGRTFAPADSPPVNFRNFPPGTLLTHVDRDGGETRVDIIHYEANRMIYIECTVSDYRNKKLPTLEDNGKDAHESQKSVNLCENGLERMFMM